MDSDERILDIARKLRIVGNTVTRERDVNASRIGLTSGQADALYFIGRCGGCRIKDLRDHMGASHQAACGIADRLAAKGLVDIAVDEDDARAKRLALTSAGEESLKAYLGLGVSVNSRALNGLTEEELEALDDMLGRILANVGDDEPLRRARRRSQYFNARTP